MSDPSIPTATARSAATADAVKLAALYVGMAGLWIAGSDSAVTLVFGDDARAMARVQSLKGFAFVLVTAAVLFFSARALLTRRESAAHRITALEATYSALVEGQSDPLLIVAPDLSIVYGNAAGLACFPATPSRLTDLFPGAALDQLCAALAELRPDSAIIRIQLPLAADSRWFAWSARAVFDHAGMLLHYQIGGHDISDHRRSEENLLATRDCLEAAVAGRTQELAQSNVRLRDFAEVSSDWLWEIDAEGGLTFLSPSYPWTDSRDVSGLLGTLVTELPPHRPQDGTAEENERMWALIAARKEFRDLERSVARPDGSLGYYKIMAKPLFDPQGRLTGWRGSGTDISRRKSAELNLLSAQEGLERRVRERTRELEQEIADRRRAEDALARDRALLRGLLDSIPDLIFVKDPDSVYLGGNLAFSAFVGRAEGDYVGKTDMDLFSPEVGEFFRGQDRLMLAERKARSNEEWVDYPDGRRVLLDTLKTPYFGPSGEVLGLIGISRDITERKRGEEALRLSEERFRQLVEEVDVIAWEWDVASQCFVYVSPQGPRMTGYAAEEWLSPGFWARHIHADDRDEAVTLCMTATARCEDHGFEYRMVCADKSVMWVRDIVHVHSENGEPRSLRGVMVDITERKRAEAQMVQTSKLATLGEMAAGMAHELNQPLHIIRMASDGRLMDLEDGIGSLDLIKGSLETISVQCQRMAEIIAHTRIFSRPDNEATQVFDPWDAAEAAVGMVRKQFGLDGIAVKWRHPAKAALVRGSQLGLEQVILNLITNARDALKGTATDHKTITVEGAVDAGHKLVTLAIRDNGPGIDPLALQRVFEPFFTTKPPGEGTGLGLPISIQIVNRMNGTIAAANGEPGAEFTVTLPLCLEQPGPARPALPPEPAGRGGAHLLVVDDEIVAARQMADLLRRSGYRVSVAGNGLEALEAFRNDPADLVVTDARMPRLDGAHLISRLHDLAPKLPVIVVSGQHDADQLIPTGRRQGEAARILSKPVSIAELKRVVVQLLREDA